MVREVSQDRLRRKALQVAEAQRLLERYTYSMEQEEIILERANGRVLAIDVYAPAPIPHFTRSGMDGFALRSEDTACASRERPVRLRVLDHIPCGKVPDIGIAPETSARIMTGAMLPEGADTVVMLEMTRELPDSPYIEISKPIPAGEHISPTGSEMPAGTLLMEKGRPIRAGEISLLAAFGYRHVRVFRKPRVAILATGSELLDLHEPLQPGKLRNSNAYMLAALVQDAGGIPLLIGKVSDDTELALRHIDDAFDQADLVITTGGVSVGDHDVMVDVLASWTGETLFNKIAMRPGSPTTAAVYRNRLLFALSGNPGACFVGFHLFAGTAIRAMSGLARPGLQERNAVLAADFPKANGYTRFIRGRTDAAGTTILVSPVGQDKSSIMSSIKDANCLIVIPPGGSGLQAGELVTIVMLPKCDP